MGAVGVSFGRFTFCCKFVDDIFMFTNKTTFTTDNARLGKWTDRQTNMLRSIRKLVPIKNMNTLWSLPSFFVHDANVLIKWIYPWLFGDGYKKIRTYIELTKFGWIIFLHSIAIGNEKCILCNHPKGKTLHLILSMRCRQDPHQRLMSFLWRSLLVQVWSV